MDKIDSYFNNNAALLFVKNSYFSAIFGEKFGGKFSLEKEEWLSGEAENEKALKAIFTYLFENRIEVETEEVAQELLNIADLWSDKGFKSLLKLECARNGIDCNKYQLYSFQIQDEKLRKTVCGNIRDRFKNKEFQSFKIQILDKPLYSNLSEREKKDYNNLYDLEIGYYVFNSSILKLFGLMNEAQELVRENESIKSRGAYTIFDSCLNYHQPHEFLRKYKQAKKEGVIEITLENIDQIEKWFEEGGPSLIDKKKDSALSLEERYLKVPKDVLFLKSAYFRKLLKGDAAKDFCITKEKWFIDNMESPQVLESLLTYILEDSIPDEEHSKEVIDQVEKIVAGWDAM